MDTALPTGSGRFVLIETPRCKPDSAFIGKLDAPAGCGKHAKLRTFPAFSNSPTVPRENPAQPQWRALAPPDADPLTCQWLFDHGSLTRRLNLLSADHFSVTPLFEGWQVLRDEECAVLGVPIQSAGWVREVYLLGHGQPWVFARSVAAREALEQGGLDLATLGSRSLGELLFCDQAFSRQPIEVCHYPAAWLPVPRAREGLWARRSRFDREALRVLVAEVFLPDLWLAARANPESH